MNDEIIRAIISELALECVMTYEQEQILWESVQPMVTTQLKGKANDIN